MHYISEQEKQTNPHLELCNLLSLIKVINVLSSSKSYPMSNLIFVFVFIPIKYPLYGKILLKNSKGLHKKEREFYN